MSISNSEHDKADKEIHTDASLCLYPVYITPC